MSRIEKWNIMKLIIVIVFVLYISTQQNGKRIEDGLTLTRVNYTAYHIQKYIMIKSNNLYTDKCLMVK